METIKLHIDYKCCSKCKINKVISEFSKDRSRKDGIRVTCKQCDSLRLKIYNNKNKDRNIERRKIYTINNKEKISLRAKSYQIANKEKITELRRKNKDKLKEYNKIYSQTQARKISSKNYKYKRRSITKQGDATTQQILKLQKNAKVCYWCKCSLKNVKVHIDHYVPLSKGGEHTLSNLVVSCQSCNLTKSAKDPIQFANSIGALF